LNQSARNRIGVIIP